MRLPRVIDRVVRKRERDRGCGTLFISDWLLSLVSNKGHQQGETERERERESERESGRGVSLSLIYTLFSTDS